MRKFQQLNLTQCRLLTTCFFRGPPGGGGYINESIQSLSFALLWYVCLSMISYFSCHAVTGKCETCRRQTQKIWWIIHNSGHLPTSPPSHYKTWLNLLVVCLLTMPQSHLDRSLYEKETHLSLLETSFSLSAIFLRDKIIHSQLVMTQLGVIVPCRQPNLPLTSHCS